VSEVNTQKTILVVEDDHGIREALKEVLESDDYRVVTAENGKEGLEVLKSEPSTGLVLLDMMMPVMNGREFLAAIKSDEALPPVPVIVVSANANLESTLGAVGFIKKPADIDLLLAMVAEHIIGRA
jgi:CheY-like chemotaxis protein